MSGTPLLLALASPDAVPAQPGGDAWWTDLLHLTIESGGISVHLGPMLLMALAVLACALVIFWIRRMKRRPPKWDTTAVTLKFGNVLEMQIRPNHETARIAFQAWVEIRTRKAGLLFEEDHDVIVEVYNSWYTLFGVLRDLTKSIPAHRLRDCRDTCALVESMFKVLNEGLRPHLTRWQAKFRRWYSAALEDDRYKGKTPQDIQRGYPQYGDLVAELKEVNSRFVEFAASLGKLAGCEQ